MKTSPTKIKERKSNYSNLYSSKETTNNTNKNSKLGSLIKEKLTLSAIQENNNRIKHENNPKYDSSKYSFESREERKSKELFTDLLFLLKFLNI